MSVPFNRELHVGMDGRDVAAVQRTLHQLGYRKKPRTGHYGEATKDQVQAYQKKKGIQATGRYTKNTHEHLRRRFDSFANYLYRLSIEYTKRRHIAAAAMYGWRNRAGIHYTQGSMRMYGVRNHVRPPDVPKWEDCSSFATWCYWLADARDPNGFGFAGYGFTGTMLEHGTRVTKPQEGDLVFYGRFAVTHVAVYVGDGRVVSHGSEGGPYLVDMHYRSDINQVRSYL